MNPKKPDSGVNYRPFNLRGWQFHVNHDRLYLTQAADRAMLEAPGFGITHLEFPNMGSSVAKRLHQHTGPSLRELGALRADLSRFSQAGPSQ